MSENIAIERSLASQTEAETPEKKKLARKVVTVVTRKQAAGLLPYRFPKNNLEDALKVAKALDDKFAGNPTKAVDLVKAVGFNKENDWRFTDLLKSSALYGLTSGTGSTATIRLEKLGEDILSPGSSEQRQKALLAAFRNVEDFKAVETFYKGKKIPEDEFFENTLIRQFTIPRDRVQVFSRVFLANLNFLKAFRVSEIKDDTGATTHDQVVDAAVGTPENREEGVREFLDTCFVMMPFGQWNDIYYKEIYIPAIKEAGFEPVRGDEIFSSGSVVEQIWEQVDKAKVLLADLTGKNPNVFYELGLSHAARKPVVFTSASLDDVPFDLRHLRVIIYDIREPSWNLKLRTSITMYLKSAKTDPDRSIPQPFRDMEIPRKA